MTEALERREVCRIAEEWVGTPFHDNACVKGHGVDCAQLLRGVFIEAGVVKPFETGYYSPQHFLHDKAERFLGFVEHFAHEIAESSARPGDVVLYRIGHCFAHGAIIIDPGWPRIVHAHYGARMVRRGFGNAVHLGQPIQAIKFFSRWGRT